MEIALSHRHFGKRVTQPWEWGSGRDGLLPGTLQHKMFSSCSWGWRHSQHELPANMKQARRRRGKFILDLPLHNKAEYRAGKYCHFRWPGLLRCRALSFLLREKIIPKALSGITVLLLVPLPAVLLCTSYYITLEALIYLNPLVSHTTLINSLTYLLSSPLHPYLLWFSEEGVGETVLKREVWPRQRGCSLRRCSISPCMQGGGEMGLDRRYWGSSHEER